MASQNEFSIPIDPALMALTSPEQATIRSQHDSMTDGVIRTEKALRKSRVKNPYSNMKKAELQAKCRELSLSELGTCEQLRARLKDAGTPSSSVLANSASSNSTFPQPLSHLSYPNIAEPEDHGTSIDPDQIVQDASQLEGSFNDGYNNQCSANGEEDNESESEGENDIGGSDPSELSNQIDAEILQTRRKSGRATEESTLRQWKAWCPGAIADGLIPDDIIDANHLIRYMQYAATRQLFTKKGTPKQGNDRLSASSLKKVNTMLGRVRRRQEDNNPKLKEERPATNSRCEDYYKALMIQAQCLRLEKDDFDVTVGTILEQQLRPQQFNEITNAILTKLDQVGPIVKSLFAWNWQTATLDRGDNVVHLILSALQPYQMSLPNYQLANGQVSGEATAYFGVLAMYWQTKTAKPGVSTTLHCIQYL
ncbi:hypothetical protein K435DRAFT_859710 [Dendrothele bispora CBS 962.96]|uniref:SAP domain-containing protein n=1 Tax=Dendrothele bispora (strain CBS 962.96) TaxID=1314807 RepID=A0A4S8LZS3_DENBC|nr:hypothetical protein K435DRAFT_859710 [Dendrothele bispora CBS 962.96]